MIGFPHTVVVQRKGYATTGASELSTGYGTVHAALECLIEPMGAWRKASLLGTVGGRRFVISWRDEEMRDGDRVLWSGRKFRFEYDCDDRYRAGAPVESYQTGFLHEEVA